MSYEKRKFLNQDEERVFQQAVGYMDWTINDLFRLLSNPKEETIVNGVRAFRFPKKDSRHAIVLKLVQLTSNLRAGKLLIDHGFFYEWSIITRVLFETVNDIGFLLAESQADNQSKMHEQFLKVFYEEDLDDEGNLQWRGITPVRPHKIREFLSRAHDRMRGEETPPLDEELMGGIYRFASGYIHGRAPHIMMLYDSARNRFHTDGWNNEERLAIEREDFWLMVLMAVRPSIDIREQWKLDEGRPSILLENLLRVLRNLQAGETTVESGGGMEDPSPQGMTN